MNVRECVARRVRKIAGIQDGTRITRSADHTSEPTIPAFCASFGHFRLSLSCRCHEGNQGVTNGLLHRVLRRAVEDQSIDDRSRNDAPSNEFPYGVGSA